MRQEMLSIDRLRAAVEQLPTDSLTATRRAALTRLVGHGLPTVKDEDWKYTDLQSAIRIGNQWLAAMRPETETDTLAKEIEAVMSSIDADWLLIVNGAINLNHFADPAGVDIERYSDSTAPAISDRPLAALNAALLKDGLRVRVHSASEKPIGILVVDQSDVDSTMSQTNVEIDVAAGCDAEIVEYQLSIGAGRHFGNSVIALEIGESAGASYVRIQDRNVQHVQTGRLSVAARKNSRLAMASYDLGGALVRNDVDIEITEPGADVNFDGLYLAGDGQHIDNHTRVDHRVGPATSSQEYRGILNGRCRCVWNGKAVVHKGADGTDANQANHNLLLSDRAEIDAKPELEIYADDVKCSHGTTVGQLDDAALFYLRSRGLDPREATQLLVQAFATDLMERTPIAATRNRIAALVESRLAALIPAAPS